MIPSNSIILSISEQAFIFLQISYQFNFFEFTPSLFIIFLIKSIALILPHIKCHPILSESIPSKEIRVLIIDIAFILLEI